MIDNQLSIEQTQEKQFVWEQLPKAVFAIEDLEYLDSQILLQDIVGNFDKRFLDFNPNDMLLTGLSGTSLINKKGCGDRVGTFAASIDEIIENDTSPGENPLDFAKNHGGIIPAIAVFNRSKMVKAEKDKRTKILDDGSVDIDGTDQHFTHESSYLWLVPEGYILNDALIAVIFFKPGTELNNSSENTKIESALGRLSTINKVKTFSL